eukprot:scaffold6243_cov15-Tisochrysis_lutea.AAC.3
MAGNEEPSLMVHKSSLHLRGHGTQGSNFEDELDGLLLCVQRTVQAGIVQADSGRFQLDLRLHKDGSGGANCVNNCVCLYITPCNPPIPKTFEAIANSGSKDSMLAHVRVHDPSISLCSQAPAPPSALPQVRGTITGIGLVPRTP